MSGTDQRWADFFRRRLWMAQVAGVVIWGTWIAGLALGGSRISGELSKDQGWPVFYVAGSFGPPRWDHDPFGQLVSVDHLAFYSPARMIREGRAAEIYDHVKLLEYQQSLFPPGMWKAFEAYRNPPFYALLYYPTTTLSYHQSAWVWNAVGLLSLLVGMYLLRASRPIAAAGWALTFLPVMSAVSYGQNSLLSLFVLCATFRLLSGKRIFLAGLIAGFLWFKPPLLIGLIFWGLLDIRRLWPAALGVIMTGALLTVGSYLIIPEAWRGFLATLTDNTQFANFDWWKMHNPRSFWRLLLPDVARLPTILWLLCVLLGFVGFFRIWQRQREHLAAVFGASVLMTLWVSPHTMIYEWTLAVIPAVLWWQYLPQHRLKWTALFGIGWIALFIGTDWGRVQNWYQSKFLQMESPIIFQISVLLIGWIGWRVVQLLSHSEKPLNIQEPLSEKIGSQGPILPGSSNSVNSTP